MSPRLVALFLPILVIQVSPQREDWGCACSAAAVLVLGKVPPNRIEVGGSSAPSVLRLRGGAADAENSRRGKKKKGERMLQNLHGSWNVGRDGGRKLKYLETEDGYGISRAKMRREKRKWKRDYGDLPDVDETAGQEGRGKGLDPADFMPNEIAGKVKKRDQRQHSLAKKEPASGSKTAKGIEAWERSMKSKPSDSLDNVAQSLLEQEEAKSRSNPNFGSSFEVSGAGTPGVNGVYEADTTGDFDKIGTAFSNGDYVMLFERAGKVLSKGNKIKRDRWLIFNDEEGVHGDKPYYELLGKYSSFNGQWRVVSGAGPAPKVREEDDEDDEDDDLDSDDGDGSDARKPGAGSDGLEIGEGRGDGTASHRDKWLTGAASDTKIEALAPNEDPWKDLEKFVVKTSGSRKRGDDGDDSSDVDSEDPLGADISSFSEQNGQLDEVAGRVDNDLQDGALPEDIGEGLEWPEDDDDDEVMEEGSGDEEQGEGAEDEDDEVSEVDSESEREAENAKEEEIRRSIENRAMLEEGVRRGMGFKEIETEMRASRGEYRGALKQIYDAYEKEGVVKAKKEVEKKKSWWRRVPKDIEEFQGGRVELSSSVETSKGRKKMSSRRYRTIAAALYHACEAGGGVVTIDKGEYEEDETLCFAGKITLRGRDGGKVLISGPKGKPVVHCEDPEARVLIIGIELSRIAKKNEENPAVHIQPVDWNSCVRVSCGVVRLTDCKVTGVGCVGILCGRGGLAQLVSCQITKCTSDGAAAADGGVIIANRTLFARNGDNGCSAQGAGSLLRLQACNLCNNGNNGVHSQHGAKVVLKGCALDRNSGSGAYGCGVPIHARPGGMCFGNTKSPGADLELAACRMRHNAESGMTVVHKAHGKVFRCSSNQNGICGVAVMNANATLDRTVCMNNTQHGLVVESAGWANVSRGNLSCNVQDGVAVFGFETFAFISACHITANRWGVCANEKAEVTLQGQENKIRMNDECNEYETHGGRVFTEYTGYIHPIFDKARYLSKRQKMTKAQMEGDSSHDWSFENNDDGEMHLDVDSENNSEFDIVKMESTKESSGEEGYHERNLHDHRPTGNQEEIGDLGGMESSVDVKDIDF